jgi:Zn-dependent peptidase ImmA (M78 family)
MHEFKHVLDHTTKQYLYRDRPSQTAAQQAERVADYFAACLLMPKMVVKRLWCQGNQNINLLAEILYVSPKALRFRLDQLGLTEQPNRCSWPPTRNRRLTPISGGSL